MIYPIRNAVHPFAGPKHAQVSGIGAPLHGTTFALGLVQTFKAR